MYHNGYIAALASGDPWYVAQSLICQSDSYHAVGQYSIAIQAIEEALQVIAKSTDEDESMKRAKGHLLSCWADNAMMLHDDRTTQEKLDASEACLDPNVPNEEFDRAAWLLIAGKYALNTRNYAAAKNCFEDALTELPEQWLLRRAMTATGLAMAYARLGERDSSLTVAKDLALPIKVIDAQMTNRWFTEYLQQDLLGIFPTDGEVQSFVAATRQQLPQQTSLIRSSK
jgi:tetratricopeptide (TPR) repeat protein